ncbi:MAG: transketolase [Candidatus Nanopelagicales bacterium]
MTTTVDARRGPAHDVGVDELRDRAHELRRTMLRMASDKGEGYIAQGLGLADALAVLYFRELELGDDPQWVDRDRFLLSTGHYSLALYAALHHRGYFDDAELAVFGLNGSRLALSTFEDLPGVEMTGGSLGHGLGQGVGMAMASRLTGRPNRVVVELSDGEMQEGSTWEAAAAASSFRLDHLTAVVDCNGIQADGPLVLDYEPVADKWAAFGWDVRDIDGNDVAAVCTAFDELRAPDGRPKAIVLRTAPGHGIPTLVSRPRSHFVRVEPDEWASLRQELEDHR